MTIEIDRQKMTQNLPMSQLLDKVDAFVYVIDLETYELLYLNETAQKLSQASVGQTCWKALHAEQTGPCSFCTNHLLVDADGHPNVPYVWEYQHEDGQWYECHDQAIRWNDGRLVRLQIAHNINERKRHEGLMAARVKLSQLPKNFSAKQLMQAFLDEAEQLTASQVGFFHLVEEDQIHLNLQAWSSNTLAKMCNVHVVNEHYPVNQAGVWVDCIREKRPVVHNDYASLPHRKGLPEGHVPVIREVVVPIFRQEQIVAVIGVGNKDSDYDEQDIRTLTVLADMAWDIVAAKQTEEKLRQTETMLVEALKATSDGVWSWDIPSGALTMDSNTRKMFGLESPQENLPASEILAMIPDSDRTQVETALNDLVEGRSDRYDQEFRIRKPDGKITWLRGRGQIVDRDSQGRPLRFIGTNMDITQSKQTELDLKESAQKYRSFLNSQQDAIFLHKYKPEGFSCFSEINVTAIKRYGYSYEEFMHLSPVDIALQEDDANHGISERMETLLRDGNAVWEAVHLTKAGARFPVEISSNVLELQSDKYILSSARDITERKQSELLLIASEERFKTLSDLTFEGIVIHKDGFVVDVNESVCQMMGYSRKELLQEPIFNYIPEQYLSLVQDKIRQKVISPYTIEITRKDHTLIPVEVESREIENREGHLRVTAFRDITERKQAEKQHLELEVQLRQKHKMEAVGYMAGGMAHNFNNNLGIILGNVELSLMKQPPQSEVIPLLKNAKIAVDRSRDLIMKIITYSRQGIQQSAPMQLTTIVDETLGLIRSTLPATVTVQKVISPDCDSTFIDADASQIQEVLINLSNNAIQAMQEKGELKIQLEPVELNQKEIPAQYDCLPGHYAKLSVQDSGCGMPAEMLDKIFDPFFTTKEAHEGAGMGLATVQGIVAQHGGFIKVNSVPDQGTVFNLYFPIIEQAHTEQPTAEDTTLPKGTERILFVDDDKMLASLGEKLLTEMGYQVIVMTESTEALKMFAVNAEHFDLVITDQTMPQLSGKDLIEELKKIKPDIPTILCTGYSSKINEEDAKELGISAFMMKPLDLPKLAQTVRRVLDGR